jgi:hypothetical protein
MEATKIYFCYLSTLTIQSHPGAHLLVRSFRAQGQLAAIKIREGRCGIVINRPKANPRSNDLDFNWKFGTVAEVSRPMPRRRRP